MNRNWPTLIASAGTLRVGCNLQIAIFENKINTSFSPSCDPKIKKTGNNSTQCLAYGFKCFTFDLQDP